MTSDNRYQHTYSTYMNIIIVFKVLQLHEWLMVAWSVSVV
jgi:hypothetical protein